MSEPTVFSSPSMQSPPQPLATAVRKTIAVVDERQAHRLDVRAPQHVGSLSDTLGRPLRDLRVSVTDRCNFRCRYCMPREVFDKDYAYLPHSAVLSFEEIERAVRIFVEHGVRKVRLTGGEPLLRRGIESLIERLARISIADAPAQRLDLTLTTNGSLLERKARALRDAGLSRLSVSLDALDEAIFQRMNDADYPAQSVLDGIAAAQAVGFDRIKVNMVVKRSVNAAQILPMASHFRGTGVTLRFIEYMDVGATNGWRMDEVLPSADILALLRQSFALVPLAPSARGETAERWGWANAQGQHDTRLGEVGFISSVTRAFCGDCNRVRLSTDGRAYLCLFASRGWDLRERLRDGTSDAAIAAAIAQMWSQRGDRYSQLRGQLPAPDASSASGSSSPTRRIEMSYIGG